MTRVYVILALSVGLAAAGCQSSTMGRPDQAGSDQPMNSTGYGNQNNYPGNTNPSSTNLNTPTVGAHPDNQGVTNVQNLQGQPKNSLAFGISNADVNFMKDAHSANLFEISASNQAISKSDDQQIKSLAQQLVNDHRQNDDKLTNLAARKGVGSLGSISQDKADQLAQLDKLNGADFNKEYLRQQRSAHQQTINEFQGAVNSVQDSDVRNYASNTLPALQEHLKMINERWDAIQGNPQESGNQNQMQNQGTQNQPQNQSHQDENQPQNPNQSGSGSNQSGSGQ